MCTYVRTRLPALVTWYTYATARTRVDPLHRVVCPGTKRDVDQGSQTTPGRAAEAYAAIKEIRDWRLHQQAGPPLPGHRGSKGSRPAADSRTQGYFRGPSPQDVALRGVMQALVRIQAYVLAGIVVAIPAVDLAVEAVV